MRFNFCGYSVGSFFTLIKTAVIILLCCCGLQSCLTAAGSAVVGGAMIYHRHNIENIISDKMIVTHFNQQLFANSQLWQHNHVVINCVNGNVLLTGEVRTGALHKTVLAFADSIKGIHNTYDQLTISTPISSWRRLHDSTISLVIGTKMLFAKNFDPSKVTVITNNKTVYLMGLVDPKQADKAVTIASHTGGVDKVVKVFQYIT